MKFGTSGLRGLVVDLQGHASALYATAFARYLLNKGFAKPGDTLFVGGDYRPSSPDIAATCMGALERAGLTPIDCGALPTPALALYAMAKGSACLMITGSHIPADRNGIKFYRPDGEIDKADEQAISALARELDREIIDLTPGRGEAANIDAMQLYAARNRTILPPKALAGLKIGVYQHSTVARDELVDVVAAYGADVVALGPSEVFIPVDTEAVSPATIQLMQAWTKEQALDAVISADGDGDRPLVADEFGNPLKGDLLGFLVAKLLKPDVVVTPVTSNSGLERAGDFSVTRTRVGSPFVIEGMNAGLAAGAKAVLGFEANGGVLTGSAFAPAGTPLTALPTRDSVLPILAALYQARQTEKPLSALAGDLGLPVTAADRLENFPTETSAKLMSHLQASEDNLAAWLKPVGEIAGIDSTDGLRVTFTDGRIIHLRPSGNAPEMRCYVEATNEDAAGKLLAQGLDLIRSWAQQP
ncbi:phosphomannomutase [Affinirhizobium pseudoryzae]|uniref:phosphomannomutase n=1 Tax=Allorhizobium pseudoryzae TaxID=379684 RepID=UPI0013EDFA10|nr:phosphomannomutase [Allorhizobium pseudoryzae]